MPGKMLSESSFAMPHDIDVNRIVRLLEKQPIVSRVDILLVDETLMTVPDTKEDENLPNPPFTPLL